MSAFEKKLFGLNKDGSFKVWEIAVHPVPGQNKATMSITHGKEGGKMTTKFEDFTDGKQGRNALQQAELEAAARVKKQMDKNYRPVKSELTEIPVIAMLSKDHTKNGKEEVINRGVFTSDKLDGVRCLAKCTEAGITLESRTGQPYNVPHIIEELEKVMKVGDILDGELYVHGPSLQEITSAVKREDAAEKYDEAARKFDEATDAGKPSDKLEQELHDAVNILNIREALEFHVFDIVLMNVKFEARLEELEHYARNNFIEHGNVVIVKYSFADSLQLLNRQLKDCIDRGFEGIMYRTPEGMYESGKRSSGLWKYKLFFDEEFKIIGVGVDKQGYAVFQLLNNVNGEEFDCVLGSYEWRLEAAQAKELYIGRYMTVQYQSRYKGTLLPQFPTGKLIREGVVKNGIFTPTE